MVDGHIESEHWSKLNSVNEQLVSLLQSFSASGMQRQLAPALGGNNSTATPSPAPAPAKRPHQAVNSTRDSPSSDKKHPKVIISYQSTQVVFMKRLRDWLNARGIETVDGTQVPGGMDWR